MTTTQQSRLTWIPWTFGCCYSFLFIIIISLKYKAAKNRLNKKNEERIKGKPEQQLLDDNDINKQDFSQINKTSNDNNINNNNINNNNGNNNDINGNNNDIKIDNTKRVSQTSQTIDLQDLHILKTKSISFGNPMSLWEMFISILHCIDTGFHFGLIIDMIYNTHSWPNIVDTYLIIALFIILFYRIVSFLTIFIYLPRYAYTKKIDKTINNSINNDNNNINQTNTIINNSEYQKTCISYVWLQLLFDYGHIIELAPWLYQWHHTKIVFSEFAWFCKIRSLLESFPFCMLTLTFLFSIKAEEVMSNDLHFFAIVSMVISIITILLSLSLYDNRTLYKDEDEPNKKEECTTLIFNFLYRLFSLVSRIIILAFLISLFEWFWLFLILFIPIVSYYIPYKLGTTDNEPLNLLFQSWLVFPDYSSPFGRIPKDQQYLNKLNTYEILFVLIAGFPLIILSMIAEGITKKILRVDPDTLSSDKEKNTKFTITVYTTSRFFESIVELLVIGLELFKLNDKYIDKDSLLTQSLFWISVGMTILFPIMFIKIYDFFVLDNEIDYDLSFAEVADRQQSDAINRDPMILSNAEYNTSKGIVGQSKVDIETPYEINGNTGGNYPIKGSRYHLRQKQYWIAIHRNNYKELAWVLRSRQHINLLQRNEREQLGIIIIGVRYDWKCLTLLIKHGGGVRQLASYAARHGELEILIYLHEKLNIDISNMKDEFDEFLLFTAIEGSQPKIVKYLYKIGAKLSIQNSQDDYACILAAKNGEIDIMRILYDAKVNLTISDENGNNCMHYAALVYSGGEVIQFFAKIFNQPNGTPFDFNARNRKGNTPAYNAASQGQNDNLRILIEECKADLSIANNDGNIPLLAAAMNDQPSVLNYILNIDENELKSDMINYTNQSSESALFWSAINGSVGCIEALVERQANLEKCDDLGNTAIMTAAEHGEVKIVDLLINGGANVNHKNQEGETALMKACAEGYIECVKVLIDNGKADVNLRDEQGNTCVLWCCMTGNMNIFKYFVEDNPKLTREYIETTVNDDKETCIDWIVENTLEEGIKVLKGLGIQVEDINNNDDNNDNNDDDVDDDDDDDDRDPDIDDDN